MRRLRQSKLCSVLRSIAWWRRMTWITLLVKVSGSAVCCGCVGSSLVSMLNRTPSAWSRSASRNTSSNVGMRVPGTGCCVPANGSSAGLAGRRVPQSSVRIWASVRSWTALPTYG